MIVKLVAAPCIARVADKMHHNALSLFRERALVFSIKMNKIMDSFLKLLLGEFGNSIGVPALYFDDDGNCALDVGTTPLSLNVSADCRVLTLSSRLDAVVDERRAERALSETMHLFRRHGFCLGTEPGAELMLRCRVFSENLTLPELRETVSRFIGAAEWIQAGTTGSEKQIDSDDYMNQLCVRA